MARKEEIRKRVLSRKRIVTLWSCCRKVEHWVQLMCCPLARLLLWILDGGWRLDVQTLRKVGVVTRTWRLEWRKTKLIMKLRSTGVVLQDYI